MRLLVTGGCGFIGSAFCRRVIKQHNYLTLVNIDYLYPCSTISDDLTISKDNYHFIKGDIKDEKLLEKILIDYKIDTIIHFAAQSHVDTSFTNPKLYTEDNIFGTHCLLEACRKWGKIKKFIHISTDEVYGENMHNNNNIFTEKSLLKPTNPYAASKASAEMLVNSYIQSYNLPAVIIRSNNVYGPGQFPEKVIPKFIFKLINNEKITIAGSGHQLRSFLYVQDSVDAILCILFQGEIGEIYNISSKDEISILDLADRLLKEFKPNENINDQITYIEDRIFNDKRYWIESEPLFNLGWKQQWSLERGLQETIKWYKECDPNNYWCSTKKRVLGWGLKGWIGSQFSEILKNNGWEVIESCERANDRDKILEEIQKVNPTHLLCLIGRTHGEGYNTIDYLEQKGKLVENLRDNLYGPLVLADIAKKKKLHLLYMGTGCIFTYDEKHPTNYFENPMNGFTETDEPNFFGSSYSVVKGYTDKIMNEMYNENVLNVRIRMPISSKDNPRNFITKIIKYNKICSIPNSMTVLDDIFPVLEKCMTDQITGPLNAVNPGVIDHNTILKMYKEKQNPSHEWEEIEYDLLVESCVKSGRSNNYLETKRIEEICPEILDIKKSVSNIFDKNKFNGRDI